MFGPVETSLRSAAVHLLSGPFLAISALLVVAGSMKIYRPKFTVGALRAAQLPANSVLVRALGAGEVAVGIGGIVNGAAPWAVAVAVFYIGFAGFVVHALRSGTPISSCGCFGSPDTPPSVGHVVLNSTATVVALAVAMAPIGPWVGLTGTDGGTAFAFLLFSVATVYLLYAIVDVLPRRLRLDQTTTTIPLSATRRPVDE
jgi:uncharacterized membrane protein YphA (DoxX/SURF4 family)